MACNPLNPVCSITTTVAGSAFNAIVQDMNQAAGKSLKTLMTFWSSTGVPDLTSPTGVAEWLQSRLAYVTSAVAVAAVLIEAAKLALTRCSEPGYDLGKALARTAISAAVAVPMVNALAGASDAFSTWILSRADVTGLGVSLDLLGPGLTLIGALLIILSSLFQMAIMVVRGAVVSILVGLVPLSAAGSNTATGRQWFSKICAWLLAFVLFKPAAAVVYAAGMQLESSTDSAQAELSGVFVLLLAVFTLPALLRLLVPATAALGSASGGQMTISAGTALATGAVAIGTVGASAGAAAAAGASGATAAPTPAPGATGAAGTAPGSAPTGPGGGRTARGVGASLNAVPPAPAGDDADGAEPTWL
jgi:type IV secretion system protein TrbL